MIHGYFTTKAPPEVVAEARSWLSLHKPCCDGADSCCGPFDETDAALRAGITAGIHYAAEMIASRIRSELVCCNHEGIDQQQPLTHAAGAARSGSAFHAICYWGEMGARLAEDPHSLLREPYACHGRHPGGCWNPSSPPRDRFGRLLPDEGDDGAAS